MRPPAYGSYFGTELLKYADRLLNVLNYFESVLTITYITYAVSIIVWFEQAPNRRQAITWTNDGLVYWYSSLHHSISVSKSIPKCYVEEFCLEHARHFKSNNHISTPLPETYASLLLLPNKTQIHLNKQICIYGVTVSLWHENFYEYITVYPSLELVT